MDDESTEADRTVVGDLLVLANTKEGATATSLETRVDLAKTVLCELDIYTEIAPGRRLGEFLHRVLSGVATWARGHAIAKLDELERNNDKTFDPDEHPSFQTAAAGELLGFVDEKVHARVRRKYYPYEPKWLERFNHKDYRGRLGRRRLYAGVWLGGQHPVHLRRQKKQRELLGAFESAIKEHLTDEQVRAELRSIAMELVGGAVSQGRHYVRRERYHVEFRLLLEADEKLIAIVGEPGNGKSELATELIQEQHVDSNKLITIRADSNNALLLSLIGELTRHGIDCDSADPDQLKTKMAALIAKPGVLDFVLIDNLDGSVSLNDLLPPIQSAVVVVTSQVNPLPDRRHGAVMQVKTMEDIEAETLLRGLLPHSSAEDRAELQALLKGHPLAIVHACGFIGDDDLISIKEFCEQLRQDAHALNVPLPSAQYTLIAAYSQILSALHQRNAVAARLLELVAFVDSSAIPLALMREALTAILGAAEGNPSGQTSFEQAVRTLQARYLIDVTQGGLAIHSLTQHILRALLRDHMIETCLLLHRQVNRKLVNQTIPASFLDNDALAWIPHLYKILCGLVGLSSDQLQEHRIGHSLSLMAQGMRQTGDYESALALMDRFLANFSLAELGNLQREGRFDYLFIAFSEEVYRAGLLPRDKYSLTRSLSDRRQYPVDKRYILQTTEGWERVLFAAQNSFIKYDFRGVITFYGFNNLDMFHEALSDSPPARGTLLTLCGIALATQGLWSAARGAFDKAEEVYRSDLTNPIRVRGIIELAIEHIHVLIEEDAAVKLDNAEQLSVFASELLEAHKSAIRDPLVEARLHHAIARLTMMECLLMRTENTSENNNSDEYDRHLDAVGKLYDMASEFYKEAGADISRYNFDMLCDQSCYRLLWISAVSVFDSEENEVARFRSEFIAGIIDSVRIAAKRARELEEIDLLLRCQLMFVKINLIRNRYQRRDIKHCLKIAWQYRERCHMPVAYADALTTAFVASFLTGHQREASLLYEATKRACVAVAKEARLEKIRNSLTSNEFDPLDLLVP